MSVQEHFRKFIQKEVLLSRSNKILLAISGGVDSMVLLDLAYKNKIDIGVAHVNYNLRADSKEEKALIGRFCNPRGLDLHIYEFKKEETEKLKHGNFQERARIARYDYFDSIMRKFSYEYLMTAHHLDDRVEGLFLRLLRSSGLDGLSGMKMVDGNRLRPLLNVHKKHLIEYAEINKVVFHDDSSNFESKYDRNYIRNEVLPLFKTRFPHYKKSVKTSIDNICDTNELLHFLIKKEEKNYVEKKGRETMIHSLAEIKSMPGANTFLYFLLKKFGFNRSDVGDILSAKRIGSMFFSESHKAVLDRDRIVIRILADSKISGVSISTPGRQKLSDDRSLLVQFVNQVEHVRDGNTEYFDGQKIRFPIEIRPWKNGDRFYPLGMKGSSKKIKDFLTNLKLSRFDKRDVYVATTNNEIFWLIGFRMDERYRVTSETPSVLKMEWIANDN